MGKSGRVRREIYVQGVVKRLVHVGGWVRVGVVRRPEEEVYGAGRTLSALVTNHETTRGRRETYMLHVVGHGLYTEVVGVIVGVVMVGGVIVGRVTVDVVIVVGV